MSSTPASLFERELAEHRARLDFTAESARISIWDWDLESGRLWVDQRTAGLHELWLVKGEGDAVEMLSRLIHRDDLPGLRVAVSNALASTLPVTHRCRTGRADERAELVEMQMRVTRDWAGKPMRLLLVGQSSQNDELHEAHRRLERASFSIQEGHWEVELATGKHWASRNYYVLLGYQGPEEIDLGTLGSARALVHPDDEEAGAKAARAHIHLGVPYDLELRVLVKDGSYRWFRLRGNAERDGNGVAVRLAGSIQDIQKQKLAEDELREAKARFERAIHGTQDGLWEADLLKGDVWLSPRLQELLGFEPGELSDHYDVLRERVHPDDLAVADPATLATARGAPLDLEVRMRTKHGEYRWFRMRGTPDGSNGEVRRVSGSISDVTEAHAAHEALIRATEAAQSANRAKSQFLANVSHEIRTPMNGIIGMTSLMLDTKLDATQLEFAQAIRASASSLLNVINDILDFSKIEAGKLDVEAVEMEMRETVEDVGSIMAFQAAAKNLELIIDVHPDVPAKVLGDPQRIRQCLINLIGNAIKFTRAGEVACGVSLIADAGACAELRFEVRDTGIGIAPETLRKLFQPFVQADSSTTRHFGGTGLGLSIVRRLVEMMGGRVGAESKPGAGSTFWFSLPMPRTQSAENGPVVSQRILVVESNETLRSTLCSHLQSSGHDVAMAANAAYAIATLRLAHDQGKPFDVVLLDAAMDGGRLCEQIAADERCGSPRMLLLTSIHAQQDPSRLPARGVGGYLAKPIRSRDLHALLHRLPRRANHAAPAISNMRYKGHVLVVEDNVVNQKVAQRFLERLGCEVTLAANGAEGVTAWQQGSYQLVLMDVQMPVMDGYTAVRQIRDLERGRTRTPIVALTANAMSGQLERCLEAGMDGLLTKPLVAAELEETLQRFDCVEFDKSRTA